MHNSRQPNAVRENLNFIPESSSMKMEMKFPLKLTDLGPLLGFHFIEQQLYYACSDWSIPVFGSEYPTLSKHGKPFGISLVIKSPN